MGVSELLMNIKNQTSLHLSTQRIDRLVAASFANAVFHAANRAETHASDCGRNLPRIEDPQEERSFTQVILASLVFACISYVYETPQSLESALYSSRTARWKTTAIVAFRSVKRYSMQKRRTDGCDQIKMPHDSL
jgi:hypothetical protein